jgi:shikimate dehydrogenase
MSSLNELVENEVPTLKTESYTAILGLTPSKGARSPILWNKAFSGLNIDSQMIPLDISEDKLSTVVEFLKKDQTFMGGAVTMPYKSQLVPLLDSVAPEAALARAVNCIYKKADQLVGMNTDGLAAVDSVKKVYGEDLSGAKVLLLGLGGAGKAVAAYMSSAVGESGHVKIANRSQAILESDEPILKEINISTVKGWPVPLEVEQFDIIINASSIGFEVPRQDEKGWFHPRYFTPLADAAPTVRLSSQESIDEQYLAQATQEISENITRSIQFLSAQKSAVVFDIIYQPLETLLLSLAKMTGHQTINGLSMNLEQAVMAFHTTVGYRYSGNFDLDTIRNIMKTA